jgi:hypothetical protein
MDSKEETIRINEIRSLFIKQCRNGIWKEHNSDRYVNDYFRIEFDVNYQKKWSIQIDNSSILSTYIGISSFLFYFLRILIRFNAKNYENKKNRQGAAIIADRFFLKHKNLQRDNKLDKLLDE